MYVYTRIAEIKIICFTQSTHNSAALILLLLRSCTFTFLDMHKIV